MAKALKTGLKWTTGKDLHNELCEIDTLVGCIFGYVRDRIHDEKMDQAENYMLTRDGSDHYRLNLQYNALKAAVAGRNYVVPSVDKRQRVTMLSFIMKRLQEPQRICTTYLTLVAAAVYGSKILTSVAKTLPFDDASFDFVHMRIVPSVGKRSAIMREIHRVLRPRGIVAFVEVGLAISSVTGEQPPSLKTFNLLVSRSPHNASDDKDDWSAAKYVDGMLRAATDKDENLLFEDVYSESHDIPVGKWPEDPVQRAIALDMMTNQVIRTDMYGPKLTQLGLSTPGELAELKRGMQLEAETDELRIIVPRDASDHSRLDLQHRGWKATYGGKNYIAPGVQKNEIHNILDLGSGSGIWLTEMAEEFPEAKLVGVDLATATLTKPCPSNVTFVVADFSQRLPFEDSTFDLVHMRIVPSFGQRLVLMREISRILRPGGTVNFFEIGQPFSSPSGKQPPAFSRFNLLMARSPHNTSGDPESWSLMNHIEGMLRDAIDVGGALLFRDVTSIRCDAPVGHWSGDADQRRIGEDMKNNQLQLLDMFGPASIRLGHATADELVEMRKRIKEEAENDDLKMVFPSIWVSARQN
ncbi:hypothetical protein CONPUDRAFT_77306 [Coniophora puteana RWD-64-598 SS2]|uniref:S-adenosyl-L-methionine-dependent methyltransferase n=1 Tax=Coniophora puteana (strain RWD-64-598) TaxID=741705 RepID=A0A5M3MAM7_CONPW|nr:uncharacterized protein CONPUDRAFT_77306 [Coniophora puteana RWD-64-598 SS2]EIW75675.1 hypothetical protein CONPUDRAFT_77306 [Coniophora puteana RWD-64-598 SS2]